MVKKDSEGYEDEESEDIEAVTPVKIKNQRKSVQ
jgi:hypothetical protein